MAKRTFVMPASLSFRHLAKRLAQDEDFVRDTFAVLGIDESVFQELVAQLCSLPFLDRSEIRTVAARVLGEGDLAKTVTQLVSRLNALVREADEPARQAMALLSTAMVKERKEGEADQRTEIARRLECLILEPPGLAQQHKAEQLASLVEVELDDIQIICDVRPVFNEDRTEIQGAVPVSRLILDVIRSDGTSMRTEVGIMESQILELRDRAEAAIRKLDAIRTFLRGSETLMPRTTATRGSED